MVNNFNLIRDFLNFSDPDAFYFVQIIKRKKDNPEMNIPEYVIKSYCIDSLDKYNGVQKEIVQVCDLFGARAYIHPGRRSYRKVALKTLCEISTSISRDEYKKVKSSYYSACGDQSIEKFTLVDLDEEHLEQKEDIEKIIESSQPLDKIKVILKVPTVHGVHFICNPFDPRKLCETYRIDVHKNNPTLLYYGK